MTNASDQPKVDAAISIVFAAQYAEAVLEAAKVTNETRRQIQEMLQAATRSVEALPEDEKTQIIHLEAERLYHAFGELGFTPLVAAGLTTLSVYARVSAKKFLEELGLPC